MKRKKKKPMVVTISGDRSIHEVARDLKKAGFTVSQVLEFTGTITGSVHPKTAVRLRKIRGVADISEEHASFNIGPPDAPIS
jgi:hypothetical protein